MLLRSAGLQATPRGSLPPWSAEPAGKRAAAPLPVCGTGTAPAPSAGGSPPLQEDERQSIINISVDEEQQGAALPLILSTLVTSSLRANIRALSSIGLPSFRLSFFRSALRRFFDDLLQGEGARQPSRERLLNGLEKVRRSPYDEMRELLWEYLEALNTLLASE